MVIGNKPMIRGIYLSIFLFRFVVKNLKTKKISYWHRKNDVFNPIISDHCWWCGQEHLTVHAQNPKKKKSIFLNCFKDVNFICGRTRVE